ncbi:MAG: HepT-like ribonuclease domain-containing protein [Candidatus Hydrogenedentota bacterium]
MPLSERDAGRLWDMLDAALSVRTFIEGVTFRQYLADRKLQLAIERLVEIIGEAARGVSDDLKQELGDVPWRGIIAQRHVLAHEYGAIKHERIWAVATQGVPQLIALIETLVPPKSTE